MNLHTYLLFDSIHYVMKAEELLKEAGVTIDLVPVPREISSDCGMCIAFAAQDRQKTMELISAPKLPGKITLYQKTAPGRYQEIKKDG